MKSVKKIFMALLIAALCVSCLAVTLFASTPSEETNYADILEYHLSKSYLADDFENLTNEDLFTVKNNKVDKYIYENGIYKLDSNKNNFITAEKLGDAGVLQVLNIRNGGTKFRGIATGDTLGKDKYSGALDAATDTLIVSFRVFTEDYDSYHRTSNSPFSGLVSDTITAPNPVNGANIEIFLYCNTSNPHRESDLPLFAMNCLPEEYDIFTLGNDGEPSEFNLDLIDGKYYSKPTDGSEPVEYTLEQILGGKGSETYKFTYMEFVDGNWVTKTLDTIIPKLSTWYQIDAMFNFETNEYEVIITPDGESSVSTGKISLGPLTNAVGADLRINDGYRSGTKTLFDEVEIYQGSYLREPANKDIKTAEALLNFKSVIEDPETTLETKIELADILAQIIACGYEVPNTDETAALYESANAVLDNAKESFINSTYVDALTTYCANISSVEGYYDRIDYLKSIKRYVDIFADGNADSWVNAMPGVGADDVEPISAALKTYSDALLEIERIKLDSNAFVELIKTYDPDNKSYQYIVDMYAALAHFDKRDSTYRYAKENGESEITARFVTVADAEVVFEELIEKKTTIANTATKFIQYVSNMKEVPVITVGFGNLYENYIAANAIYNNGYFHPGLDNSTYEGLDAAIELFLTRREYVLERVAACEDFLYYINTANSSTYYVTTLFNLDEAEKYIDADIENYSVEPEYEGINEAKAVYIALREKLAKNREDSAKYIAAVNAIADAQGFAAKKTAVEAAIALKAAGDVTGIEGVKEANIALYEAESDITAREGYSSTLISSVADLKEAEGLAERRRLIFIAKGCLDGAEDSISGVTAAKAELQTLIESYNADVAAANSAFATVASGACDVCGASANQSFVYRVIEIIKALFK